jgi:hypothetical protein
MTRSRSRTWPFEEGGFGVEASVSGILDRMQTGRFKVFHHLTDWFAEKRHYYHRKDGKIVKERDDLLSATWYAVMMLRFAETERVFTSITRLSLRRGGCSWGIGHIRRAALGEVQL